MRYRFSTVSASLLILCCLLRAQENLNQLGPYGTWLADKVLTDGPAHMSFRTGNWKDVKAWQKAGRQRVVECIAPVNLGGRPVVSVTSRTTYDGFDIEFPTWQLPMGPKTEAVFLKPAGAPGPLPAILALHDHGGNKFLGWRKIVRTDSTPWPMQVTHQDHYYGGADPASPDHLEGIDKYNKFAAALEHVMEKSLLAAGTTWPGVYLVEDQRALDVLASRPEVDPKRIGCAGLSGGGMRTVFLGGMDPRIKVGFTPTWRDLLLNRSLTHTWMAYVPLLPKDLDFPEILALRAPAPTMILNSRQDQLYTLPEMQRADAMIADTFKRAHASDHYKSMFYEGDHKFDLQMQAEAFAWFDRFLKSSEYKNGFVGSTVQN